MASFEKHNLEAAQPRAGHLTTDEKSHVIASDGSTVIAGSDVSGSHDYEGVLPDPDAGKSDEERARLVR
jgi:hypothetical protein